MLQVKQRICGSEKWTTRWLKTLECTLGSELMQAKAWWACDSDRVSWHICRHQTWEVCIDFGVRQLMHELLDFSSSQNYSKMSYSILYVRTEKSNLEKNVMYFGFSRRMVLIPWPDFSTVKIFFKTKILRLFKPHMLPSEKTNDIFWLKTILINQYIWYVMPQLYVCFVFLQRL